MQAPRVIFHCDFDAFYASVEQRDNPEYRGKPVIVGAQPGHRGVAATCSYEARAFGVRSAMPTSRAYQLCPEGIFLRPRMDHYQEVSRQLMEHLGRFTPRVIQVSVDEAFLDMTGTQGLWGSPWTAAQRIQEEIQDHFALGLSIGIAPNQFLAKIASDMRKPRGIYQVSPQTTADFLASLELKQIPGLGTKTREKLRARGINTMAQLQARTPESLAGFLGKAAAEYLWLACRGQEPRDYATEPKSRSLSSEKTLEEDTRDPEVLQALFLELCQDVLYRMYRQGLWSRSFHIRFRSSDFLVHSVQTSLGQDPSDSAELAVLAWDLFQERWQQGEDIRLLGVGFSGLQSRGRQGELFQSKEKQRLAEHAVWEIGQKIPGARITRARFLKKP